MVINKTDVSKYIAKKDGCYDNPQDNNIDEAYLLFMGDAVLRNGHPESTAAQQEYCNNNCEAW